MRFFFPFLALFLLLPAHGGSKPPQIFLRIHVQTTGEGLAESQAHTVLLPPNGEAVQVRGLPEVSEHNLVGVEPRGNGTMLFFDHQGQVNLDAATAQNQGRLLVVLLNGYVVYAPVIDQQIGNGQLLLPHPLDPQVVRLLKQVADENVRQRVRT